MAELTQDEIKVLSYIGRISGKDGIGICQGTGLRMHIGFGVLGTLEEDKCISRYIWGFHTSYSLTSRGIARLINSGIVEKLDNGQYQFTSDKYNIEGD